MFKVETISTIFSSLIFHPPEIITTKNSLMVVSWNDIRLSAALSLSFSSVHASNIKRLTTSSWTWGAGQEYKWWLGSDAVYVQRSCQYKELALKLYSLHKLVEYKHKASLCKDMHLFLSLSITLSTTARTLLFIIKAYYCCTQWSPQSFHLYTYFSSSLPSLQQPP